jgi:hypothetical protein
MLKNSTFFLCAFILFGCVTKIEARAAMRNDSITDTLKNKFPVRYFELSLGHSLLFISDSKLEAIRNQAAVIVPTNALLLFAEFLPLKRVRVPLFVNIPTQSKQFIVNNQLVSERASPTFGVGMQVKCFGLPLGQKGQVELEAGPLASFLINENNVIRFAPVVAGRIRFIKNKDFVLYMGSSYSIGIDAVGILFGTGYIF